MSLKKSTLTATIASMLALGVSAEVAASVYARSYLDINNLTIFISDDGGATPGGAAIDNFNFNLTNTAALEGVLVGSVAACSGRPGVPGAGTNNCNAASPRLDAAAVNGPGSLPLRPNNNFTFFGPGANQYSNADSVIYTTQLTLDGSTNSEQIAEAELQTATSGSSSALIDSVTGFTFNFTVAGANTLRIDFDSFLNILAAINSPSSSAATSQANVRVQFTLQDEDDATKFVVWTPDGNTATGCVTTLGVGSTCSESADGFDLNTDVATSTDGTAVGRAGGGHHTALISGLYNGNFSLTLNSVTSTALSRVAAVPEPSMLALLGIGLLGMGVAARRKVLAA